jgi:CBS domain-containing protein
VVRRKEINSLEAVAELIDLGQEPRITGRQLLSWFGAARRGRQVVARIDGELLRLGLLTEPDFKDVWVDVPLRVRAIGAQGDQPEADEAQEDPEADEAQEEPASEHVVSSQKTVGEVSVPSEGSEEVILMNIDHVPRIRALPAACKPIVGVRPGTSLNEAMTLMMLRDFSQLPILHSDRECKGAVTWQSIATATAALGKTCETVDDCASSAEEVPQNMRLLDAIPRIVGAGFVLVRGPDRAFQGIVTVADLSLQFRTLSEPFLLLGQIENLLRALIAQNFSIDELREAKNDADTSRKIEGVSDLTFGEYVRVLEPAKAWAKLKVHFARAPFLDDLKKVHELRNDVMHFDPDPLGDTEMALLRNFAAFLERVA